MFREIGQLASLMKNLPRLRSQMEELQQRVGRITAEGDAGGGMVKVKINGQLEVLSCAISDEAFKMNDREMLEDLIKAAVTQAIKKARDLAAEEGTRLMTEMGLPPGFSMPGMS